MNNRVALFLLAIISMVATGTVASAQQDRFSSREACLTAIDGTFRHYVPSFMSLRREPRADEEVRPLEAEACVRMKVVADRVTPSGRAWVRQEKGTRLIFRGTQPVSRYDCGNPVWEVVYIPPPPPPTPQPAEVPKAAPPQSPTCFITGNRVTGFVGVAINGEGRWWFGGVEQEAGDRFVPSAVLKPGVHVVEFRVTGPGGQAVCERKFDVFAPLAAIARPPAPPSIEPEVKKPRRKWPYIVAAIAGGVAAGGVWWACGDGKKPAVGGKPATTVISPP